MIGKVPCWEPPACEDATGRRAHGRQPDQPETPLAGHPGRSVGVADHGGTDRQLGAWLHQQRAQAHVLADPAHGVLASDGPAAVTGDTGPGCRARRGDHRSGTNVQSGDGPRARAAEGSVCFCDVGSRSAEDGPGPCDQSCRVQGDPESELESDHTAVPEGCPQPFIGDHPCRLRRRAEIGLPALRGRTRWGVRGRRGPAASGWTSRDRPCRITRCQPQLRAVLRLVDDPCRSDRDQREAFASDGHGVPGDRCPSGTTF